MGLSFVLSGIVFSGIWLGIGIAFGVTGVKIWRTRNRLWHHGVNREARIINYRSRHLQRSMAYYVTYHYHYEGKPYTREQPVSKKTYSALHVGAPIHVRCLPEQPAISMLEYEGVDRANSISALVLAVIYIGIGGLVVGLYISRLFG